MRDFFQIPIPRYLFVFALLVRLLIMPFLYHPDIKIYNFQSSFLSSGVLNIYDFLNEKKQELPFREEFVYQPLAYLFWGSYQVLIKPLLGVGFKDWLWDASQQSVENFRIFRFIFLLKLPLLFFDVLTAFLLASFFDDKKRKSRVFTLWLLNPFSIFIIYAYSGFDIIVSFLVLLSLYLAKKDRLVLSSLFLVLGSLFKAYPLLLLPIIFLKVNKFSDFLKMFLVVLATFLSLSYPFFSKSFISGAISSGLMNRIFAPSIDLGFGVRIIIPFLIMFIVYLLSRLDKRIELYFFLLLVVVLSFIHFHIQWLVWILPLLILFLVKYKENYFIAVLWFLVMFFLPFLYDDKQMTVSLFSLFSRYFSLIPYPFVIVQKVYNSYYLQSLLQTASSSLALFLLWKNINYIKK
jgi:hypothetical protein